MAQEKIWKAIGRFRAEHKRLELEVSRGPAPADVARICGCPACTLWLALEGEEPPPDIHPLRVIDRKAPR